MEPQLIDSVTTLQSFLEELPACQRSRPNLYVDLEGNDLCRQGTLSLVTLFVESKGTVHLVDVTTLKELAFSTTDSRGRSLRTILQAGDITKVVFDIRNDSDALFSHYGIAVQGIEDVQLMEIMTRSGSKGHVNGLAKCIESNPNIEFDRRRAWSLVKERGQRLFRSSSDGYAIFDRRPLSAEVLEYCVQDVTFLPKLRDSYRTKLCDASWRKIQEETLARIALSQGPSYNGKGRHMALAPPGWQFWDPTLAERREQSFLNKEKAVERGDNHPASSANESGSSGSGHEITSLFEALQRVMDRTPSPEIDFDDELGMYGSGYPAGHRSSSEGSARDFAACDIECGYCGHCMY